MPERSQIFYFGECLFQIEMDDPRLLQKLETMFLPAHQITTAQPENLIVERLAPQQLPGSELSLELDCAAELMNRLYARHKTCLWLDAACLVSPHGKIVLIAGASSTGKSTLTLALALGRGWRVVTEDIVLIEPKDRQILLCPGATGIRRGTKERLAACGIDLPIAPASDWYFSPDIYLRNSIPAKFDYVLRLEPMTAENEPLATEVAGAAATFRSLLRISNAVRSAAAVQFFAQELHRASCFKMRGGELSERISWICDLAS